MRFVKLTLWLALLPLVSGCFTMQTLEATKSDWKALPDEVLKVEKALLSRDERLLIFVEARLTNAPAAGRYTLSVSLKDIQLSSPMISRESTNGCKWGFTYLSRRRITAGWNVNDKITAGATVVSVSDPLHRSHDYLADDVFRRYRSQPYQEPVVYQLIRTRQERAEFIYADAGGRKAFIHIEVQPEMSFVRHPGAYCLLPLAVAGDIVTFPLQLILFGILVATGPHC